MARRPAKTFTSEAHSNVLQQLQDVTNSLDGFTVSLNKNERIELLPARKGFEDYLYRLISIAKEKGLNLEGFPHDEIEQDVKAEAMMRDVVDKAGEIYHSVQDTYRVTRNKVWEAFLAYYKMATALSKLDPAIETRLKPIVNFMSNSTNKKFTDDDDGSKQNND